MLSYTLLNAVHSLSSSALARHLANSNILLFSWPTAFVATIRWTLAFGWRHLVIALAFGDFVKFGLILLPLYALVGHGPGLLGLVGWAFMYLSNHSSHASVASLESTLPGIAMGLHVQPLKQPPSDIMRFVRYRTERRQKGVKNQQVQPIANAGGPLPPITSIPQAPQYPWMNMFVSSDVPPSPPSSSLHHPRPQRWPPLSTSVRQFELEVEHMSASSSLNTSPASSDSTSSPSLRLSDSVFSDHPVFHTPPTPKDIHVTSNELPCIDHHRAIETCASEAKKLDPADFGYSASGMPWKWAPAAACMMEMEWWEEECEGENEENEVDEEEGEFNIQEAENEQKTVGVSHRLLIQ